MSFLDNYYQKPVQRTGILIEVTRRSNSNKVLKKVGKTFLTTLAMIFSKKKENIKPENYQNTELTRTGFNELASKLSSNFLKKNKKEVNKFYVKNLFNGAVDNPQGIDKHAVKTNAASVFKLNNGARVILVSTEDAEGNESYHIGTDNVPKVNNFFMEHLGRTYPVFIASKRLLQKKKRSVLPKMGDDEDIEDIVTLAEPKREPKSEPDKAEPEVKRPEVKKEVNKPLYYVINTSDVTFDHLIDMWGDGTRGEGIYTSMYKFKNKLKKSPFENNWGAGFKYDLGGNKNVYLLRNHDNNEDVKLLFDDKLTFARAKTLEMVPWLFKTKSVWEPIDIHDMGGKSE